MRYKTSQVAVLFPNGLKKATTYVNQEFQDLLSEAEGNRAWDNTYDISLWLKDNLFYKREMTCLEIDAVISNVDVLFKESNV